MYLEFILDEIHEIKEYFPCRNRGTFVGILGEESIYSVCNYCFHDQERKLVLPFQ